MRCLFRTPIVLSLAAVILFMAAATEDCGDVQHDVETGMIRLPDFSGESIKDLNCSWTYKAPQSRKLLVKVDNVHLPPLDLRTSLFKLYIDDQLFDIPRNCVKCLREMVGGEVVKVVFVSYPVHSVEPLLQNVSLASDSAPPSDGVGSFQVRFKSFDPYRCSKPETVENGYTKGKGRKLGQKILYYCNPPYDLIGSSEVECVIPEDTPVPDWSFKAPKCIVRDCDKSPILREAGSGAIASPGYPTYINHFTSPCYWEITAELNQQIKISITYLKIAEHEGQSLGNERTRLSLLDGDTNNFIVNLTESIGADPLNFTTLTNKLIVQFIISEDNKGKEETGFYLEYSAIPSSCPNPDAPISGEVIAFSRDLGSVIAYRCHTGFVLIGEPHSECMLNGLWSNPTPRCESLTVHTEHFIGASNDSDTVTANLTELPPEVSFSPPKPSRSSKKKSKDIPTPKPPTKVSDVKEKQSVPKEEFSLETFHLPVESEKPNDFPQNKKTDKENGPKSEPHLQQVVPPKDVGKKAVDQQVTVDVGRGWNADNITTIEEQLPPPDSGFEAKEKNKYHPMMTVTMISIIAGVGAPLAVGIVLLIAVLIYRRRYPVRMRFGRKFSTFENPMYVTKDAQHPRELKRLTT